MVACESAELQELRSVELLTEKVRVRFLRTAPKIIEAMLTIRPFSPLLLLAAASLLSLSACKKYDDGPAISLTPRAERIANTWVIERATENGQDVTDQYDQYVLTLTSGGGATLDASYVLFGVQITTQTTGTWHFENNDEHLVLDFEEDLADGTYLIQRLTQSQLWLRQIGDDLELRLKPQ